MHLPKPSTIFWGLVIAFVLYAVVMEPAQAADTTHTLWEGVKTVFSSVGTFFGELIDG